MLNVESKLQSIETAMKPFFRAVTVDALINALIN